MSPAQPIDAWTYEVKVGSQSFTQAEANGLESLAVEVALDLVGVAELTFGTMLADWTSIHLGDDVEVDVGPTEPPLFRGVVTSIRYAKRGGREKLVVTASDALAALAVDQWTRSNHEVTDSDFVNEVLGALGVTVRRVDTTSARVPATFQRNESDLVFLRRLAARNGFFLWAEPEGVIWGALPPAGTPIEVDDEHVLSCDYTLSALAVPMGVGVRGWITHTNEGVFSVQVATDAEPVAEGTLGVGSSSTLWKSLFTISDLEFADMDQAMAIAKAECDRMSRNYLRGRATILGNPMVRAGTRVKLDTTRHGYRPTVLVLAARHVLEPGRSYVTELTIASNLEPS